MFDAIATIFTGKGGTLRLALCFTFLYETMNCGYGLRLNRRDGASLGQSLPFSSGSQEGQDKRLPSTSTENTSTK